MKSILTNTAFGCCLLLLTAGSLPLSGHAPDQSYTFMRVYTSAIEGRFEIHIKDLNRVLGLDLKPGMSKDDLLPFLPRIQAYLLEKTAFSSTSGNHAVAFTDVEIIDRESLGDYVNLHFQLEGITAIPEALLVKNEVGLADNSNHRGLLVVEYNWKAGVHNNESFVSLIFSPDNPQQPLSLKDASLMKGFIAMIKSGMHHIYIGIDHILFLLALLLPSVVRRQPKKGELIPEYANRITAMPTVATGAFDWVPVERFRPAFFYVLKIITLFTVAHTITLSLAALQIVVLPSRIVESIIALSIGLAALHNIRPIFRHSDWIIVFGFGLFHGFGFASVLADIGLSGEFMTLSLLGFNLGVEVGQVLIIAVIFPVLFLLRKLSLYPNILVFGSALLILISLNWVVERFFEVDMPLTPIIDGLVNRLMG